MAKSTPVYPPHTGFLLAEDEALKALLVDNTRLPDGQGVQKPVDVWYRYPQAEREAIYPFITIELISINPAYDLWTSDYYLTANHGELIEDSDTGLPVGHRIHDPSTLPSIPYDQLVGEQYFQRRNYLPYRLIYQLTLWTKSSMHDRLLTGQMFRDVLGPHPSWLLCTADGTWKRLETLQWTSADIPTQEGASKRIFRKIFTISVQTELPQDRLHDLTFQNEVRRMSLRMFEQTSGVTGAYLTPSLESDYWETLWNT